MPLTERKLLRDLRKFDRELREVGPCEVASFCFFHFGTETSHYFELLLDLLILMGRADRAGRILQPTSRKMEASEN